MRKLIAGLLLGALAGGAEATSLTPLTFTVYADSDYPRCCGVVPGIVRLASYRADERAYGFAEFDLAGASQAQTLVYLSFSIHDFYSTNPLNVFYPTGSVVVEAYAGDNQADRSDVTAPTIGPITSYGFETYGPGSVFNLNVTSLYDLAVSQGQSALGVRFSFSGFGRDVTVAESLENVSLGPVPAIAPAVPESSEALLLLAGLPALILARRRLSRSVQR